MKTDKAKKIYQFSRRLVKIILPARLFYKLFSKYYLRRWHWLYFSGAFLFLVCFYVFFTWRNVSAARLDLLSLKNDVEQLSACHEDCRLQRQIWREKIALAVKNEVYLAKDLEKYFLTEGAENETLRRELLKIFFLAYDYQEMPNVLVDCLASPTTAVAVKEDIIRLYLANYYDPSLASYYLAILVSEEDIILKKAAVNAFSRLAFQVDILQREQLVTLTSLILNEETDLSLRLDLMFLLQDYSSDFSSDFMDSLVGIYKKSPEIVLKYLAAEGLLSLGVSDYPLPVVTDEDWEFYFN